MSRYLLDTGPLMALLLARPGAVELMQPWLRRQEAVTSMLVCGEAFEYLAGRADANVQRQALVTLLKGVVPRMPGLKVMNRYAELRRQMRPPHGSGLIGDIDTVIAATALQLDVIFVTMDGDFARVPGLKVMQLAPRTFTPVSGGSPPGSS